MMMTEWIMVRNGQVTCSPGALFQCHHCEHKAWYWIGYWPYCSMGHDQRVCPFSFLDDFDRWFAWQLKRHGGKG